MTLNRNKFYAVISAVSIVTAALLQLTQKYRFYAKEVENLWLNDWMWISPKFFEPGGITQLLTSLFTQFYSFWGMGALILTIVFFLVFMFCWKIQRNLRINDCFMMFWLLTLVFMALCNEHTYFNLKGHFAFLLSIVAGWGYTKVQKKRPAVWLNVLFSFSLVVVTYWLAGSAAVLTVTVIILYELFRSHNWLSLLASVFALVAMAWLCVRFRFFINMEEALTPAQYYEWPSTYFMPLYAWISVPLILLVGKHFSLEIFAKRLNQSAEILICAFGIILAAISWVNLFKAVHNERVYLLRQEEWMARVGDWDGIIEAQQGKKDQTAFVSYLNLALAKKGELVERMSEFNPYIVWDDDIRMYAPVLISNDELSRDALKLQSCVFMEWGGAALANAQKAAFEANMLTPGETDPIELQRLVTTNTLFDTEKTAEKYRRRLERTTFYGENKFLHSNQGIQDAASFVLPEEDSFYYKTQVGRMLRQIAMQSPDNKIATQFYEAYLVQSRDTTAYRHWQEFVMDLNADK